MVDIGSIASGMSSLKAAKNVAKALVNFHDTANFQSAVVELQGKILAAQTDQFALLERIRTQPLFMAASLRGALQTPPKPLKDVPEKAGRIATEGQGRMPAASQGSRLANQ